MAKPQVFRVYDSEEAMLAVYNRRLRYADGEFERGEPERREFLRDYRNEVELDELDHRGNRVTVTTDIGLIDTMYSSMTSVEVEYICRAVGHGTTVQAIAATNALNQGWRDTKGARRAKKAVKDALLVDIGWVKVYYDYKEDVDTRDRSDAAVKAEMFELLRENPDLTDEDLSEMVPTTEEYSVVVRDRVCVDYVPWDMVRWDTSARQIEDVRWVAQYVRVPVGEVTNNPTYQAFVEDRYGVTEGRRMLDDLEGDSTISSSDNYDDVEGLGNTFEEDAEETKSDDVRLTVVEMTDLETGLISVFPKNHTDLILHQRMNPLMLNQDLEDRNPFKPLMVRDDPGKFAGLGDARIIAPGVEELERYREHLSDYTEHFVPKLIGPDRALTAAGKKALQSQEYGEYIALGEGHDYREVGTLTPPAMPEEIFAVTDKVQEELKEATGASEVLRGVFPQRETTATETRLVTTAGENRQAERRSLLEDWYTDIARTMLQLMQIFYDQDRVMRYTDDLGQEFVWEWSREDIAIEADIDIALTPKENLTRQERFSRAIQVMNLTLPLPTTDQASLIQWVLRETGLSEGEIRAIVKSPQEVQLEQQQQEVAALATQPQPGAPGLGIRGQ